MHTTIAVRTDRDYARVPCTISAMMCCMPKMCIRDSCTLAWYICLDDNGKDVATEIIKEIFIDDDRVDAVSYTHLDVYKRQK